MSDTPGPPVRGMSSNAQATSLKTVSMFLLDPNTGTNFAVNDADYGHATNENAGLNASSSAVADTEIQISPIVATITFNGVTWTSNILAINLNNFASAGTIGIVNGNGSQIP